MGLDFHRRLLYRRSNQVDNPSLYRRSNQEFKVEVEAIRIPPPTCFSGHRRCISSLILTPGADSTNAHRLVEFHWNMEIHDISDDINVKVKKYQRGESADLEALKGKKLKGQLANREELYKKSANAAAQAEKVNS